MRIDENTATDVGSMALVCGITPRRVQQLVNEGVLVRYENGAYPLAENVQRYAAYHAEHCSFPDPVEEELEREIEKADVQLKQAKAEIAALQVAELKGEVHREEDVVAVVGEMIFSMRSAWLALPGRCAVDVAAATTPDEVKAVVQREVDKVLKELWRYRYDPKVYADRVRERMKWGIRQELEDEEQRQDLHG